MIRFNLANRCVPLTSSSRRRPGSSFFFHRDQRLDSGLRRIDGHKVFVHLSVFVFALCLSIWQAAYAIDPLPFKDHAEELRFQALTKQLRCLVCQNESLADSNAPLAADLRRDVFEQMRAGKSDAEIKAWLTARYSDFVLYDPPLHAGTWLLWFGPALVLLAGAVAVVVAVRRRAMLLSSSRAGSGDASEDDW